MLTESHQDGVAILTMDRPERRNALDRAMIDGLLEALPRLARDESVGCVVLTGAGAAFCAGGDVKAMSEAEGAEGAAGPGSFEQAAASLRAVMECSRWLHQMPKPTLASLPGAAAGAGLAMALACDLRIAVKGAKLTTAFAKVGLSGDFGGSYFLSRLVGTGKARELYYLGDVILSDEAFGMGVVNWLVEPAELAAETMRVASRLADGPRTALAYMKRNLNLAEDARLEDVLDQEALFHTRTAMLEDHAEAARAFSEKRAPKFARPDRRDVPPA
jgi:2-(1,2-epoxy-1,2-dihydrophenyl)acetyl-CoA isomerase